ncbi:MAG: carbohydrate ABC transporter permease [Spirochaeta sp.]
MQKITRKTFADITIGKIVAYIIFISFAVMTIYPLVWLLFSSFKPMVEIVRRPLDLFAENPTVSNYAIAWVSGDLGIFFVNSLIYTSISTAGALVFAMMASYAFAKMEMRYNKVLYALFLMGQLISIHAILVPLYIGQTRLGLADTRIGVILPYIAVGLPICIYIGTEFMRGIPNAIIESAYMDGANNWRVFGSIVLPMCKPILITLGIVVSLQNWNEFLLVFILTSRRALRSLPVGVFQFSGPLASEYGLQFAALVISSAPMVVLYMIFRRQITQGVVAGAVKE